MAEEKEKTIKLTEEQLINAFAAERANFEALQARIATTEGYLREILAARDALKAIQKAGEKEKIIVPLGAGIYIDAVLENSSAAKSSLAGGVVVNTTIEEALKELEAKKPETEKAIAEMQMDSEKIFTNINSLASLLRAIEQQKREQRK